MPLSTQNVTANAVLIRSIPKIPATNFCDKNSNGFPLCLQQQPKQPDRGLVSSNANSTLTLDRTSSLQRRGICGDLSQTERHALHKCVPPFPSPPRLVAPSVRRKEHQCAVAAPRRTPCLRMAAHHSAASLRSTVFVRSFSADLSSQKIAPCKSTPFTITATLVRRTAQHWSSIRKSICCAPAALIGRKSCRLQCCELHEDAGNSNKKKGGAVMSRDCWQKFRVTISVMGQLREPASLKLQTLRAS